MQKRYIIITTLMVMLAIQGCATIHIKPTTRDSQLLHFAPHPNQEMVLMLPLEFQEYKYVGSPTKNMVYAARTFEFSIGGPLSDSIYKQLSVSFPKLKIERKYYDDCRETMIIPSVKRFEFAGIEPNRLPFNALFADWSAWVRITILVELRGFPGTKYPVVFNVVGEGFSSAKGMVFGKKNFDEAASRAIEQVAINLATEVNKQCNHDHLVLVDLHERTQTATAGRSGRSSWKRVKA